MAKAFYTQDEAKAALNTDEPGLKALTRDGRLTEYRDGQRLMYKGSQVENLVGEMGGDDAVDLSDTGGSIGLVDSSAGPSGSGSGSALGLADSRAKRDGSSGGFNAGSFSGGAVTKEDTAGGFTLSENDTGVDPVGGSMADSGITIFGPDDDSGIADTGMTTGLGDSSGEQVNLEGIGSGSGLLDLTQEPDDTSFGAETFDEIMPGESGMGTVSGLDTDTGIDTGAMPAGARQVALAYEPYDPSAPMFGGLAAGAAFAVLLGLLSVASAALGATPGLLSMFFNDDGTVNTMMTLIVLAGLPILGLIVGLVGGKMANA